MADAHIDLQVDIPADMADMIAAALPVLTKLMAAAVHVCNNIHQPAAPARPGRVFIEVPAACLDPAYTRRVRVDLLAGDWTEVVPGVEVRGRPHQTNDGADLEFRFPGRGLR